MIHIYTGDAPIYTGDALPILEGIPDHALTPKWVPIEMTKHDVSLATWQCRFILLPLVSGTYIPMTAS